MSRVKFRGKTHLDKWIYGGTYDSFIVEDIKDIDNSKSLFKKESATSTMDRTIHVLEDTIGQYTGEHDDNGIEIYEGDIIQEGGWDGIYIVEFEEGKYIGRKIRKPNGDIFTNYNHDLDWFVYPIIIGNIYENPKLLKAQPN